jgi:hypothetical protein
MELPPDPLPGRRPRERFEVADEVRLVVIAHLVCDARPIHVAGVGTPRGCSARASRLSALDPGKLFHRHAYMRGELARQVLARDADAVRQRADPDVAIGPSDLRHGHSQAGGDPRRRPEPPPGEGKHTRHPLLVGDGGPDAREVGVGARIDHVVLDALVEEL